MTGSGRPSPEPLLNLASRKRCDLKTRKRCDFYSAAQKIASDFSAISSAIFWRFLCDFCSKTCNLVLCDLKTQRFFCDCDFWDAKLLKKRKRPQPYWGGDNSGNALEASNALNYRAWGIQPYSRREFQEKL